MTTVPRHLVAATWAALTLALAAPFFAFLQEMSRRWLAGADPLSIVMQHGVANKLGLLGVLVGAGLIGSLHAMQHPDQQHPAEATQA